MIIAFIIGGIFLGIVIAGILAPVIIVSNKKKLREMDKIIEDFESKTFSSQEEKEKAKQLLKKELIKIKAGIIADEKSTEQAADKISIL